ncbi:MAG TPA: TRAP transporter substrate-binding protein [Casimicrobiaceae bacterium]|nr:TRAP transporter substrate-binding protein [Casimicrobiaceae bacterium]
MQQLKQLLLALAALGLASANVAAQDFKPFKLTVVGNVAGIPQSTEIEGPVFKGLASKSGGKIDVRFRTFQELGMNGEEMARLASRGSFDLVALLGGYVSGDAPFFIGSDIPGLAATLDDAKQQSDAYRDVLDKYLQEHLNVKLLTLWPYPLQVLYCRMPVNSLDDLKGKRIRVHGTALSDLVKGVGGIAVDIPFAEVYTSLQRGVADCAATSTVAGNAQKWYEVSSQMVTLPLGWAISAHVANKAFWDKLEPGARAFLTTQMNGMEKSLWDMARDRGDDALSCNMGGDCKFGTKGAMKLYRLTPAELTKVRSLVADSILRDWAKECTANYKPCVADWNQTIGKTIGVSIK